MILLLSVRLLHDRYHGRTANGEQAEWPPSPFRLFQAIVAGNARGISLPPVLIDALQWLETLDPPEIIAPKAESGKAVLTYVLNNTQRRSRTPKTIRSTLLDGDRLIQYLWRFDELIERSLEYAGVIASSTRHIRALGWGIDMAIGHGEIVGSVAPGIGSRIWWVPAEESDRVGIDFRSPRPGSLASLQECYSQYLNRYASNEATQLESGAPIYCLHRYTSDRPRAIFKLLDINEDTFRYPHDKLIHVAGMVRYAAVELMSADPPSWIEDSDGWVKRVVHGKRGDSSLEEHRQFSYVPLPSIGHEHSDAMIRSVMIVAPLGMDRELKHLAEKLDGERLNAEDCSDACTWESRPLLPGLIELQRFSPPEGRFIRNCYLATADTWQTVTPVILPGHDDHKPAKTVKLIQRALQQSGIDTPCEFMWQSIPFFKNTLSAHKRDIHGRRAGYFRPSYLKENTAVHLRIRFGRRKVIGDLDSEWMPANVTGPIVIGAGRHCGFGLLAVP
jgi:CRISPR-associated protein Csb2